MHSLSNRDRADQAERLTVAGAGWPARAAPARDLAARTAITAASSASVGWPRTTDSTGQPGPAGSECPARAEFAGAGPGCAPGRATDDSLGISEVHFLSCHRRQFLDLPTPTPNCRCTRAQNASRSHSRASWYERSESPSSFSASTSSSLSITGGRIGPGSRSRMLSSPRVSIHFWATCSPASSTRSRDGPSLAVARWALTWPVEFCLACERNGFLSPKSCAGDGAVICPTLIPDVAGEWSDLACRVPCAPACALSAVGCGAKYGSMRARSSTSTVSDSQTSRSAWLVP